eukprot:417696-Amphidinium_carterae.1
MVIDCGFLWVWPAFLGSIKGSHAATGVYWPFGYQHHSIRTALRTQAIFKHEKAFGTEGFNPGPGKEQCCQ